MPMRLCAAKTWGDTDVLGSPSISTVRYPIISFYLPRESDTNKHVLIPLSLNIENIFLLPDDHCKTKEDIVILAV